MNANPSASSADACVACPTGSYAAAAGSVSCTSCPAGYACHDADAAPALCPANTYAPLGSSKCLSCPDGFSCPAPDALPVACPTGTYSPAGSALCRTCPAGFACAAAEDIAAGAAASSVPQPCPSGTTAPAGTAICVPCPAGHACPDAAAAPVACSPAFFATAGAAVCSACPAGAHCPLLATATPVPCPAGSFATTGAFECSPCKPGSFCPAGAAAPLLCPAGTRDAFLASGALPLDRVDALLLRSTLHDACAPCPAGTYGADSARLTCLPCAAGHVCAGATTQARPTIPALHNGMLCPTGHYCPAGAEKPLACPAGSANPVPGAISAAACAPCGDRAIAARPGAAHCTPCGASAVAAPGGASCACVGAGRFYMSAHGECRCRPGYVSYDSRRSSDASGAAAVTAHDVDSTADCVPVLVEPCADGEVRSAAGVCVDPTDAFVCASACAHVDVRLLPSAVTGGGAGLNKRVRSGAASNVPRGSALTAEQEAEARARAAGRFDPTMGICVCAAPDRHQMCPYGDCTLLPQVTVDGSSRESLVLTIDDPLARAPVSMPVSKLPGFYGPQFECAEATECKVVLFESTPRGHKAVMGVPRWLAAATGATATADALPRATGPRGVALEALLNQTSGGFATMSADALGLDPRSSRIVSVSVTSASSDSSDEDDEDEDSVVMGADGSVELSAARSKPLFARVSASMRSAAKTLGVDGAFSALLASAPVSLLSSTASALAGVSVQALVQWDTLDSYDAGYYSATACLPLGGGAIWQLNSTLDYPVYIVANAINTNPTFDASAFTNLPTMLAADPTMRTFGYSFNTAGTYVFARNNDFDALTVLTVMPYGVTCPVLDPSSTATSTLVSLGISQRASVVVTPDLWIVYILILAFVGVSILIAIFAKLSQYEARRVRALNEMPDDSIVRQNFRKIESDLTKYAEMTESNFQAQIASFTDECDRIAAETEQIKALLAVKITENSGFLRAAKNLLMAETTSRQAYDHSQASLEKKIVNLMQELVTELQTQIASDIQLGPNTPLPKVNDKVAIVGNEVVSRINEMLMQSNKEDARRKLLARNAGVIGEELVTMMNQREERISDLEGDLLTRIINFRETVLEPNLNNIQLLDSKFAARASDLRKQRNHAVVDNVKTNFKLQIDEYCENILLALVGEVTNPDDDVSGEVVEQILVDLREAREMSRRDGEQALLAVRKLIAAATTKQKQAVFVGVPPELEKALRLFLCQAGAAIMPHDVEFGGVGLAREDRAGGLDEDVMVDPLHDMLVNDDEDDALRGGASGPRGEFDDDIDALLSKVNDSTISADDIKNLYGAFMRKQELMEKMLAEQKGQALDQAQEMLGMDVHDTEDRAVLEKATEMFKLMLEEHENEKQLLLSRLAEEQQREMAREIEAQALKAAEDAALFETEKRRLEEELEIKRRGMVAGSEEEHASISEHILKLKKLEDAKKAEANKYQQSLRDKHQQWKQKRKRELDALKLRQKGDFDEKEKDYAEVVTRIKKKEDEENKIVAGIDVAALAQQISQVGLSSPTAGSGGGGGGGFGDDDDDMGLGDDEEMRAEKKRFLEEHAARKRAELQRDQDEAKRRLDAEIDREAAGQMAAFEDEARAKREAALAQLEEQQMVNLNAQATTADEGRRLMEQFEREKAELKRQMEAEEAAQRAKLEAALRARQAARAKALAKKHDGERQDADAEQQQFEKELVTREKKQKEEELLTNVIGDKNLDATTGANVISSVMAERQKRELADLLRDQRADAARKTKALLDDAYSDLFSKKEDVRRAKADGTITEEEEKAQLAALDKSIDENAIRAKIESEIKGKHEAELRDARDQYNQEIKDMFGKIFGKDTPIDIVRWEDKKELQRKLEEAEARKREEEEEIRRKQAEVEADIARMKEEAEAKREEQMRAEMERVEAQIKKDQEDMQRRFEEQQDKARKDKEAELAEKERRMKEDSDAALDDAERQAILKRYNEDVENRQVQDELEKKRQMMDLQDRLKGREEQRKKIAARRAQDKVRQELEKNEAFLAAEEEAERLRKERASRDAKLDTLRKEAVMKLVKAGKMLSMLRQRGVDQAVAHLRQARDAQRDAIAAQLKSNASAANESLSALPDGVRQAVIASLPGGAGDLEAAYLTPGAGFAGVPGAIGAPGTSDMFVTKVDRIERLVRKVCKEQQNHQDGQFDKLAKQHVDAVDEMLTPNPSTAPKQPVVVSPASLNARQFLLYRYGVFVTDYCANALGLTPFSLLLASALPVKLDAYKMSDSLYKNSIHYDVASRTIFVHESRINNVGKFALILTHTIAHIAANDWHDESGKFQKAFYYLNSSLMAELFFSRTALGSADSAPDAATLASVPAAVTIDALATPSSAGVPAASSWTAGADMADAQGQAAALPLVRGHSKSSWQDVERQWTAMDSTLRQNKALRDSFTPAVALGLKEDVIGDFLDSTMLSSEHDDYLAREELFERLDQYRAFRDYAPLKRELLLIEENVRRNTLAHDMQVEAQLAPDARAPDVEPEDIVAVTARAHSGGDEPRMVQFARLERLRLQSDRLNLEMVSLVTKLATVGAKAIEAEAAYNEQTKEYDISSGNPPPQVPAVLLQLRDKAKRLGYAKTALAARIANMDARIATMAKLAVTKEGTEAERAETAAVATVAEE